MLSKRPKPLIDLDHETLAAEHIKTLSLDCGHGSGAIFCCINSEREKTDVGKKRGVWGSPRASGPLPVPHNLAQYIKL